MTSIDRRHVSPRMSQVVIHGDTVYLAGQVANRTAGSSVTEQTREILARIDALLAEAGTDKSNLLQATIWLAEMDSYDEMNRVWDAWVTPGKPPVRACIGAGLADPAYSVEIRVIAAKP